jgi:nitrogen regulatory protein PII-like uncharacterized protein
MHRLGVVQDSVAARGVVDEAVVVVAVVDEVAVEAVDGAVDEAVAVRYRSAKRK